MEIKEKTEETAKKTRMMKIVEDSKTEQVHLIMHQHLNAGGRLFGGMLMQWVDEVSGVVAMRHCGTYRVTTAAVDNLQFKERDSCHDRLCNLCGKYFHGSGN